VFFSALYYITILKMSVELKANIVTYINWAILELVCNRYYKYDPYTNTNSNNSKLYNCIKDSNYDFNYGISHIADLLVSDDVFQEIMSKIKNIDKNIECGIQDDVDEAELIYETFKYVNKFIGLNETSYLRCDDTDLFMDKLYLLLKNKNT